MDFVLQPTLQNEFVKLVPLKEADFEILYKAASDPLIWEQHPNKKRWQREVFQNFFKGAIESKGAFIIYDAKTNEVIGSSRFYDWSEEKSNISIGYTFYVRSHWGGKYNPSAKHLMMEHAFKYVDSVIFHIGADNIRSQKAIERLGAKKIAEEEMAYYGEDTKLNFIYEINKNNCL
ncbi:MAG TPA: GNAT family N-acetyltransferase [Bacteroidia bacterium]|jgi:RimJ/RimL family protein N-acetyltransferase|nr:GNAT family N-acetyltransferase [Bacteroidia bacterium]